MLEDACERQKKGKTDNCALCKELDKNIYKQCKIRERWAMVFIECSVESLDEIENTLHKEIEGIVFRDDKGKEKRFKVKGMLNQTTAYMKKILPEIDWDWDNIHVAILIGDEIKWRTIEKTLLN